MFGIKLKFMEEAVAGDEGTGTGVAQVTPVEPGVPTDWLGNFSDEDKGYAGVKGWDGPEAVIKSYRNLESMAGNPNKMLKMLDDDASESDINNYYSKLGRPENAQGYEITMPEAGGDEALSNFMRDTFFELGLNAEQAKSLSEKWNEFQGSANTNNDQTFQNQINEQTDELKVEWGAKFDHNVNMASQAANQFGISDEDLDSMEEAMGFKKTMTLLNDIGKSLGEDSYAGSPTDTNGFNVLSPAEARVKIQELKVDTSFQKRYMAGESTSLAEMDRLQKLSIAKG